MLTAPDEDAPVHADHHSAAETKQSAAARAKVCDHFRPAPLPAEQHAEEDNCPDKAVCQNFQRRKFTEQFPINGHQSPGREGGDAGDNGRRVCGWCLKTCAFCLVFHRSLEFATVHLPDSL